MFEQIKKSENKEAEKFNDHVIKDPKELEESYVEEQKVLVDLYKLAQEKYVEFHEKRQNGKIVERWIKLPDGEVLFYDNVKAFQDALNKKEKMLRKKVN